MKRIRRPWVLRQDRVGYAYRWCLRQGPVPLVLHVAAFTAFTVAAFTLAVWAGFVVLGVCCLWMETNTREPEHPR